jgi:hypothetical protein
MNIKFIRMNFEYFTQKGSPLATSSSSRRRRRREGRNGGVERERVTSQSARAPVTELEGTAGVTNVGHGHDVDAVVDATKRPPAVTFGQVTTIEVT